MEIPKYPCQYHCDTIPFDYEKVQHEVNERCKNRNESLGSDDFLADLWRSGDATKMDEVEPSLYNCLIDIDQKLNLIIRHLSSSGKGPSVIPQERDVEIGPCGIRFYAEEELAVGDILKVRMLLPLHPLAYLAFLSEVTEVARLKSGRYEVYINYSKLSSDEKDQIITYLFKKQREAIREDKQR